MKINIILHQLVGMIDKLARRFTVGQLMLLLLGVMIVLAGLNVGAVYHYQSEVEGVDNAIDVAGEQRYTTMQMTLYTERIASGDEEAYDQLEGAMERYETNLEALRYGGGAVRYELDDAPPETHDELASQREEWSEFSEHLNTILEEPPDSEAFEESYQYVHANDDEFLDTAESTVEAFAAASNVRISHMQSILVGLFAVNFVVFLVGAFFTRRYVGTVLSEISDAIETIGEGSLDTEIGERTQAMGDIYDDGTKNEIITLVAVTERMES